MSIDATAVRSARRAWAKIVSVIDQGGLGTATSSRRPQGPRRSPPDLVRMHVGARDLRERARRYFDGAVGGRADTAGMRPFAAAFEFHADVVGQLSLVRAHHAGAACAPPPASADSCARRCGARHERSSRRRRIRSRGRDAGSGRDRKSRRDGRSVRAHTRGGGRAQRDRAGLARKGWQSSQRDHMATGTPRPTPNMTEAHFAGSSASEDVAATPMRSAPRKAQHGRPPCRAPDRDRPRAIFGHRQAALRHIGENAVLQATRGFQQHLVAQRVERERERHPPFGKQRPHFRHERRPDRADAKSQRR